MALGAFYFATFVALGAYLPFFAPWLAGRGASGPLVGAVLGLAAVAGVLGPPLFGALADALGLRRELLRLASALALAAALGLVGAAHLAAAPALLGLFAVLFSLFRAPLVTLADVVALEASARGAARYGAVRLMGSLGFLLAAALLGAALDLTRGLAMPTTLALGLAGALAISARLPAARAREAPSAQHLALALRAPGVARLCAVIALAQVGHAAYDGYFSLHLLRLGLAPRLVGAVWALGVLAEIVFFALAHRFVRGREGLFVSLGALTGALRFGLLACVDEPAWLALAQPLHALSFGALWLPGVALAAQRGHERPATTQGLFQAAWTLGSASGLALFGVVLERAGTTALFAVAAVISCVAAALSLAWLVGAAPPSGRAADARAEGLGSA